jgi:DNA mismatch repair protein MutS
MTQAMSFAIYDEYEKYIREYQQKYGENTIVLLQVGSFYEIYSINNGLIDLKEIGEILGIQVTRKNKQITEISKKNCLMAGFPEHALGKFMNILLENNYTVVVVSQVSPPPKPRREVTDIKSPGTRIDEILSFENNFLMSIYFEETQDYRSHKYILSIGVSYIDLSTGKSYVYECTSKPMDKYYALDELYRIIIATNPKEILLIGDINTITDKEIITYLDLHNKCIHNKINNYDVTIKKPSWQKQLLQKCFPNHGILSPVEFIDLERSLYALLSYISLLQFAHMHSENIIEKLQKPLVMYDENYVKLSYNTAKQLNIVSGDVCKTSLIEILNNCKTAIGKRRFKERILNPSFDTNLLKKEYDNIEFFINSNIITNIGNCLSTICDVERHSRKLMMNKLHPTDFITLISSLKQSVIIIDMIISNENNMINYKNLKNDSLEFIEFISNKLNLDEITKYHIDNITSNIFNKFINEDLDILQAKYDSITKFFKELCEKLNNQVDLLNPNSTFFKLENTEKDGFSLSITAKRYDAFKKSAKNIIIDNIEFDVDKIEVHKISASSTIVRINHNIIKDMNNIAADTLENIKVQTTSYFIEFLKSCHVYEKFLHDIINFIATIDYQYTNAYNAKYYNYCRPIINNIDDSNKSYVIAKSIRHPIIERIQDNIEYISNDIQLGIDNKDGLLLYGVNASGKSSLMKSIGLCVIMASAGMYVPCSEFVFYPYKCIFSRIPTGDNLGKGQSTFTNEVSELRDIMKRADSHSLVIGDELCSATESISAMSIVSAGIITLCKRNTSFIFATHLHDLTSIDCIKQLENLDIYHLSVEYDTTTENLIYDRKLKIGQGSTLYGLEVMKGLGMDLEFINLSNSIRQGLLNIEPNIISSKQSKYNAKLFKGRCSICDKPSDDVHHIKEQHTADSNGFIGSSHKNALFNLINLCKECHIDVHNGIIDIKGYKQTTNGIILETNKS